MQQAQVSDELYGKAVVLMQGTGKASTSFIQRNMQIGYNRAARIMKELEDNGIVTKCNEVGKRKVVGFSESDKLIEAEQTRVDAEKASKPELPLEDESNPQDVGGVAGQRLQSFIERIERLEQEKAALLEDIKEVYAELKGVGFDVKATRKIVKLRKMDTEKRREEDEILELYKSAIGMI